MSPLSVFAFSDKPKDEVLNLNAKFILKPGRIIRYEPKVRSTSKRARQTLEQTDRTHPTAVIRSLAWEVCPML